MPQTVEKKTLPYTPQQLFDLVLDIEKYPQFLPWCLKARVYERTDHNLKADLNIGYGMLQENFTSYVTFTAPHKINVDYVHGPFRHLKTEWIFEAVEGSHTRVTFKINFSFRTGILQKLIEVFFHQAFQRMVTAFENRAQFLYPK